MASQRDYLLPRFSSCESTDAARRFTSVGVGFLVPLRTLEAKVETFGVDCFFAIRRVAFRFNPKTLTAVRKFPKPSV